MVYGTDFNAVDIGAVLMVFLELLLGLRRGLAGSLFRLVSTGVVLGVALCYYRPLGDLLVQHTPRLSENPDMAEALAFLLIAIGLGLCFLMLRVLLNLLMTVAFNESINPAGGAIVGTLHGLVLVILIVYAMGFWPQAALQQMFVQTSLVGRTLFKYSPRVMSTVEQVDFRDAQPSPRPKK